MSQAERILYLDKMMRSPEGTVTVSDVVKHFEVSERQVKRDIEYLRDRMNAPIIYDYTVKAYRYEKEFNDLELLNQDIIISYLSLKSLAANKQYFPLYQDSLLSAIDKEVPSDYKDVCRKINYYMPPVDKISGDYFEDICSSMRDSHCISIEYMNLKGEKSTRLLEIHRLINYGGNWYLIAFDRDKEDLRTFNMSRIIFLSLTKKKYERRTKAFEKEIEEYMKDGFGIYHGKKAVKVKILFSGQAARIVSTQKWHEKQVVEQGENKKGEPFTELTFPVTDYTEILYKVLSFGSQAKPLEPLDFVQQWKDEIKKMSSIAK